MNDGPNFRAIFRLLKYVSLKSIESMKATEDLKTVPLFSTFIRYLRVSKLNIGHSSTHVTCSNCFSVYNTDLRSFLSWSNYCFWRALEFIIVVYFETFDSISGVFLLELIDWQQMYSITSDTSITYSDKWHSSSCT